MPPTKGILGVKKNPKRQMLFSFGVREGEEWPSDDSEDSDFTVDDQDLDNSPTKRKKKQEKNKLSRNEGSSKKKIPRADSKGDVAKSSENGKLDEACWRLGIPWETLHKIFLYVTETEGALPFLVRASKVCQHWRDVAIHQSLWTKVDLSYGWVKSDMSVLEWLCTNRLSQLRELNLSTWKSLTNIGIELLVKSCPELSYVGLSNCSKIRADGVVSLINGCEKLTGLDLSNMASDAVSPQVLKLLIEKRGPQLTHLNLSGNALKGFSAIFTLLTTNCPNLRVLQMNKVQFSSGELVFNIETLQTGCPQLKILEMALIPFRMKSNNVNRTDSGGFTELEELSVASHSSLTVCGVTDNFLRRTLKDSTKLSKLDIRGAPELHAATVADIPATDLQILYMPVLSSTTKAQNLADITAKWQHSLVELSLAWNLAHKELNEAVINLGLSKEKSKLEIMDLSGTAVDSHSIRVLVDGCPHLVDLNLSSCRALPRGIKRQYNQHSIQQLKGEL